MCEYVYIRSSVSGFNAKQILLLNYDLEVYGLANIKSAKKRVITSQVRAERNKAIKSRVKTYIKKVEAPVSRRRIARIFVTNAAGPQAFVKLTPW